MHKVSCPASHFGKSLRGDCCTWCHCTHKEQVSAPTWEQEGSIPLGPRCYWAFSMGNIENNWVKSQRGCKKVSIIRGETAPRNQKVECTSGRPAGGLSRDPQTINTSKRKRLTGETSIEHADDGQCREEETDQHGAAGLSMTRQGRGSPGVA